MTSVVQFSHDEMLLMLGLLRLPIPLVLGEDPSEGRSQDELNSALTDAAERLLTREYLLQRPEEGSPIDVKPAVKAVVMAVALADTYFIITVRQNKLTGIRYFALDVDRIIAVSVLEPGQYRCEQLPNVEAVSDHLISDILPHATNGAGLSFRVDADVLSQAIGAAEAGNSQTGHDQLCLAGISSSVADRFISSLGPLPAFYRFISARDVQSATPMVKNDALVHGIRSTFYTAAVPEQPQMIEVVTVDEAMLRGRLLTFLAAPTTQFDANVPLGSLHDRSRIRQE